MLHGSERASDRRAPTVRLAGQRPNRAFGWWRIRARIRCDRPTRPNFPARLARRTDPRAQHAPAPPLYTKGEPPADPAQNRGRSGNPDTEREWQPVATSQQRVSPMTEPETIMPQKQQRVLSKLQPPGGLKCLHAGAIMQPCAIDRFAR